MKYNLHDQLSGRLNPQLIATFKILQSALREIKGIAFRKAIPELPPLQIGGKKRPVAISTVYTYEKDLGNSKGGLSLPGKRAYIIQVIELCCQKWDLELNSEGFFIAGKGAPAATFRFEGNYYIYCYASVENAVHRYPLHIDNRGIVRMALFDISGHKTKDIIQGLAQYDGHAELSISFHDELGNSKFRHYLFSVMRHFPPNQLQHAYGVSLRTNHRNRPVARMEILVCTTDSINDGAIGFKEFNIYEQAFNAEDLRTGGFLNWLTGKYNRLVIAPARPNKGYSRRWEEYVDIYFYSACYLARKGKIKESLANLYQAFLHGYDDLKLLDEELEPGGCLRQLYERSDITSKPVTSPASHKYLNGPEIIGMIRVRALHIRHLPPNKIDH